MESGDVNLGCCEGDPVFHALGLIVGSFEWCIGLGTEVPLSVTREDLPRRSFLVPSGLMGGRLSIFTVDRGLEALGNEVQGMLFAKDTSFFVSPVWDDTLLFRPLTVLGLF